MHLVKLHILGKIQMQFNPLLITWHVYKKYVRAETILNMTVFNNMSINISTVNSSLVAATEFHSVLTPRIVSCLWAIIQNII